MTLDFNSQMKADLCKHKYPSADHFSAEEIIVLTAFLDGPKNLSTFLEEEYPDVFGQGLIGIEQIGPTLEKLCSRGILVSASSNGCVLGFADQETRSTHATLQSIARITRRIADDIAGLGTYASQHLFDNDVSLVEQLEAVREKLSGTYKRLKQLRSDHVRQQLDRLGICAESCGLQLNIGSGLFTLPSPWINIDFSGNADLVMNLQWGLPFSEGSVDYIYGAHFFEHMDYRSGAMKLLKDFHRILSPGGKLRLAVPNISGYISAYANSNDAFFEDRCRHNPFLKFYLKCKLEHVLDYAGAGMRSRAGEFFEHKFGYDFDLLSTMLYEAGFKQVSQSQYMKSSDPVLLVDKEGTFSSLEFGGIPNSIFVEAIK